MESCIDKIDITILHFLYMNSKRSSFNSSQIKPILKHFEESNTETISYPTLVRRLNKLTSEEYILLGYKVKNSKTYYITEKGVVFLENDVMNKENLYDYISIDEEINDGEEM